MDMWFKKGVFIAALTVLSWDSFADCFFLDPDTRQKMLCRYDKYDVQVSCNYRMAMVSRVSLKRDVGNENTSSRKYYPDKDASALNCQQTSSDQYSRTNPDYDVGHLTAIDHLDDSLTSALQTNSMTNLVPQNKLMNRYGAWKRTESLVECYRDDGPEDYETIVFSGVMIGSDISNDHFSRSHGLPRTPDYMWKLVYFKKDNKYDAWVIRNDSSSTAKKLAQMRVPISKIILELKSDNEVEQGYSIELLENILVKKPNMVELNVNRNCQKRIG